MMTNLLHVDGHVRDRRSINSDVFSLGLPMALTKWGVQAFLPCGYLEADKIDPVYSCRAERFVNIDTNFIILYVSSRASVMRAQNSSVGSKSSLL